MAHRLRFFTLVLLSRCSLGRLYNLALGKLSVKRKNSRELEDIAQPRRLNTLIAYMSVCPPRHPLYSVTLGIRSLYSRITTQGVVSSVFWRCLSEEKDGPAFSVILSSKL